ncbi:hypothetical protein [Pseudonocardia nigra]|uniref:hypothetical protein n=1 Tax=Pseudonocardia nigra TaxID=1921578 RepID=UPI001C5F73B3|nr:hypothetical protein [Pseudonocardia nigra]
MRRYDEPGSLNAAQGGGVRPADTVISVDDVRAAARRLEDVGHHTPVITSRTLDQRVGGQVFVKCENFPVNRRPDGRAYHAVSRLDRVS